MSHKFSLLKPDTITDLLRGAQGLTDPALQWLLVTLGVAAYFVVLGWVAFTLSRRVHAHCRDTLFQDKEPRRRRRMTLTLTICLAALVISIGFWSFTRIWDLLIAI